MLDPSLLPKLLTIAVLLPLASFFAIWIFANWLGKGAGWLATGAIGGACLLSFAALLGIWLPQHWPASAHHGEHAAHSTETGHAAPSHGEEATPEPHHDVAAEAPHAEPSPVYTDTLYTLGQFGPLRMTISYYIDSLTICMFCMVTLIATCIHFYAVGYMHDELSDVTDREVSMPDGRPLHRPGRFPRFFQYLSLFCFSMLGLVLSGNIAMVFVFWELVGICSYFLIGFYIERKSASNAANKAFIVNRVGDFGMIIGLMALWSSLGTFAFGDVPQRDAAGQVMKDSHGHTLVEPGIFSLVRPGPTHALTVPDGMVQDDAAKQLRHIAVDHAMIGAGRENAQSQINTHLDGLRARGYGYWLLVVAGIGIFCGCVGKSAQFPLHVWLPDAMEGPTPVSALVHSATMVAAGVYLVGRFFPVFAPEVLLVIAIIGCITMLLGATIAFAAVDIKRVLAYSTVSQLGLMMLALGLGGWAAGVMHLITHAFFKSLLFMCSGSVIHAVHTNDMRKMGGLFNKMPVTAVTMLIGCLAIAGVAVPFVVGFSGYYSKDAILEQAMSFWMSNRGVPWAPVFFILAIIGAAFTSCYMFRMWFMTFAGKPRDQHAYDHAHESPPVMVLPLVLLAVLAITVAWNFQLIGFGLVAAAFFIARGVQLGWFKMPAAHGHAEHGHDDHGHADHSHDSHANDSHGHVSPVHDHAHDVPARPHFTWAWVGTMLLASIIGGLVIQYAVLRPIFGNSPINDLTLTGLLEQSRPAGTLADAHARWFNGTWPDEHFAHQEAQFETIVVPVTLMAAGSWVGGILLAAMIYWWGWLSADDIRRQFAPVYTALVNKYWFDELYDAVFVKPTHVLSQFAAGVDRRWIDGLLHAITAAAVWFAKVWDVVADRGIVDGLANLIATWTYSLGLTLRTVQTGRIRQYVMFIVVGAIAIFALISFFWSPTLAR